MFRKGRLILPQLPNMLLVTQSRSLRVSREIFITAFASLITEYHRNRQSRTGGSVVPSNQMISTSSMKTGRTPFSRTSHCQSRMGKRSHWWESGSGKSTITNLFFNIYETDSGQILIDGKNIKLYNVGYLRRQLGIVNQEPVLFNRLVSENITVTVSVSSKLSKRVRQPRLLTSFARGIKQGSDSEPIGKKTQEWKVKSMLRKSLSQMTKCMTQIRRFQEELNCHKIVVMKSGKIIEEGQYHQLIHKQGHFYNLIKTGKNYSQRVINSSNIDATQLIISASGFYF